VPSLEEISCELFFSAAVALPLANKIVSAMLSARVRTIRRVVQLARPTATAACPRIVAPLPATCALAVPHRTRGTALTQPHTRRVHSATTTRAPQPAAAPSKEGDPSRIALTLSHLTKRFSGSPGRVLFKDLNLSFYHGAKIGILGANGCGKSSFLKILGGLDSDIDGAAKAFPGYRIGYLAQEPELDLTKTVSENIAEGIGYRQKLLERFEAISLAFSDEDADFDALSHEQAEVQAEIEKLNCWDLQYKVDVAMAALNCPPGDSRVDNLSGGERRRVALCRLLLSEPDILLLDEPTNHLDAESVSWLEQFLGQYNGLVIAITHDRYFLDKIAGWILEIDQGQMYPFKGNYAAWLESKSKRTDLRRKQSVALEKQIEKELQWVRSSVRGRQGKSKSRLKNFEKLMQEKKERMLSRKSEGLNGALLIPEGPRLTEKALEVTGLTYSVSRSDNEEETDPAKRSVLFENLSFRLGRGEMLGIIGPNGSGKTSLLKCLIGEKAHESGEIKLSKHVVFGYNTQSREALGEEKQVWQEIVGQDEQVQISPDYSMPARAYVAQFNFSGADQTKLIRNLSGGERNRVSLAKSLKKGCNVIILDEPTNDLDVDTLRALEESLQEFDGAGIIVSHDRWFLDRVCTHILAFEEGSTQVRYFEGNYSEYEERKKNEDKAKGGEGEKRKKFKAIKIDT
jgi:sulfate-transporting ATPase